MIVSSSGRLFSPDSVMTKEALNPDDLLATAFSTRFDWATNLMGERINRSRSRRF
jgi:hypothetical protein